DKFQICNGYEHLFLPTFACGGDSIMGIAPNIVPRQLAEMYRKVKENDFKAAADINRKLVPVYNAMETSEEPCPGPVKYVLKQQGFDCGLPRKPVVDISDGMRTELDKIMKAL
ncbi:dihydrodipicolinate synthase family protein, partial [Ruminococcaceae bacterium OttesenSCG-928-I18]|nr:dihydrodipicolinate synthase family protein [Ruminococcaceae bacterium OttesenSCG-928-I18]